jgi:small GTP-binding protein
MMIRTERSFKVVLLGSTAVGKSSIMKRVVDDTFNTHEESTIGAAFYTKRYPGDVTLQIWDTAGQERYAGLAPMYYRGADAIVSVYDVTSKETYLRALNWIKETCGSIDLEGRTRVFSVLVGNKIDCDDSEREVTKEMGERGTSEGLGTAHLFMETSAKSGENVHIVFKKIAQHLLEQARELSESSDQREFFLDQQPVSSRMCC